MNSPVSISVRTRRAAAAAIAGTTLLVMVALFHHPVVGPHGDAHGVHVQITQLASADNLVHGALTTMLVALASALAIFGETLGPRRPAVSGALAAYCLGGVLLGVAMLFDGFILPGLAAQFIAAPPSEADMGILILRAASVVIQVFSKAGLVAQCAAILMWSYAAATSQPQLPGWRWCAAIGVMAGLPPAALILFGDLPLTPHSLMALFAAHAAWYLAAAWSLYRSGMPRAQAG